MLTGPPPAAAVLATRRQPFAIDIGPIAGLTTAWHRAPDGTSMPVNSTFLVKVDVPADATITWHEA